ncbi:MAG: hypothetical protein FH749_11140 [Firmicutes bacterium]|nr:hypothetical protein [Bacillota bacterium]
MKILVFGAGPLGSLKAARLHEAGHDVTVLARNQRLADIKQHGIVIVEDGSSEQQVARVKVTDRFTPEDYYDLVIVMRKNQATEIIPTLAANKKVPTLLFMVNTAAGFDDLAGPLGKERVMMGFPYPGGQRDGHLMRVMPVNEKRKWTIPVGETDGSVTDRTRKVAKVLVSMRGYKVQVRKDMDAWLKNHVALMIPAFAPAMYAANISMKRMGNTRDLLVLTLRGQREALRALNKAGIPPSPGAMIRIHRSIPEPIMVGLLQIIMRKELGKASMEGRPKAARDEMRHLTDELFAFLRSKGLSAPICESLYKYFDPDTPPLPEGTKELPLRWGGDLGLVGAIALIVLAIVIL